MWFIMGRKRGNDRLGKERGGDAEKNKIELLGLDEKAT